MHWEDKTVHVWYYASELRHSRQTKEKAYYGKYAFASG